MNKIITLLRGGLGNQMFQYALARSMSLSSNSELVLDNWSGFIYDYKYHRKYELDAFPIVGRPANLRERIPFWLNQLGSKFSSSSPEKPFRKEIYGLVINEIGSRYIPDIFQALEIEQVYACWLNGYWQSPLYFEKYSDFIANELMPPQPTEKHFLELGKLLTESESVALGIRLYEESKNPEIHTSNGQLKTTSQINQALLKVIDLHEKARFLVFCTHRSPLLEELSLPEDTIFVTHDDGYLGTIQCMWLLTQCKHHIFTNSTFYWWGAWLSQKFYSQEKQTIFAANNFTNSDTVPRHWNLF
jgi:hypothetical protein